MKLKMRPIKLRHVAASLGMDVGCGDNSCIWGSPGGMATNGGCRCYGSRAGRDDRVTLLEFQRVAAYLLTEVNVNRFAAADLDTGLDTDRASVPTSENDSTK